MAIPWGEIIQGVTTVAKAAGKGAAKGAKAAGKAVKSTAKSGKRMAQNIIGEGGRKDSVITPSAPQAIPATPLIPSNITPKTSSLSTGVLSIDKALDRIDNSLFDLISYTADSSKVQKTSARRMNVERNIQRKRKRESILESSSKFIRGLASKAPKGLRKTFDALKNFITSIAVGSLLLYLLQEWDRFREWYDNTVKDIKEIWTRLEPIILPIWEFLKWFGKWAFDNTKKLISFAMEHLNPDALKKKVEDLQAMIKPLEDMFKAIGDFGKSLISQGNVVQNSENAAQNVLDEAGLANASLEKQSEHLMSPA